MPRRYALSQLRKDLTISQLHYETLLARRGGLTRDLPAVDKERKWDRTFATAMRW
jgi:hypothetical protein